MHDNENLRNEIFMLKKIMLEVEKRDLHVSAISSVVDTRERGREKRTDRFSKEDNELEQMRNRPERPSRSPINQVRENFGVRDAAPRYGVQADSGQHRQPINQPNQAAPVYAKQSQQPAASDKTNIVRQSGMFNRGSQGSDILTWDNPYHSQDNRAVQESNNIAGARQLPSRGGPVDPPAVRDRKLIEDQLSELDLQVEKTQIELNSVANNQPKTGVTMKKKRELEDRIEVLEKQRANLRSRLRMGFQK